MFFTNFIGVYRNNETGYLDVSELDTIIDCEEKCFANRATMAPQAKRLSLWAMASRIHNLAEYNHPCSLSVSVQKTQWGAFLF